MDTAARRLLVAATAIFVLNAPIEQSASAHLRSIADVRGAETQAPGVDADEAPHADIARPHRLAGPLADVIVRVDGTRVCSGVPISGTMFVVTAAHCLLDRDGDVAGPGTVRRAGAEYDPVAVLLDPSYHDAPSPRNDAAILVMAQTIPGPSAALGAGFPTTGSLTIAGLQALDTDGSLLRGTRVEHRPRPRGATGGIVTIHKAVAGCVNRASAAVVADDGVRLPCGLIPGASGGGAFVEDHGELILVGIVSTVGRDLSFNDLTPLSSVRELVGHPARYTHEITSPSSTPSVTNIRRF